MVSAKKISAFDYSKIVSEKQLTRIIESAKSDKKTVGLCVGSYDLLHPGHMKHFESAKDFCDILVVSVTADKYVRKRKGLNRPIISEDLRVYSISQLTSVDYVIISPYERATQLIIALKPSYYIKGSDYINKQTLGITAERKAIAKVGGGMKYTFDEKLSTTDLINDIKNNVHKPFLVIGAGMAAVGKSILLKGLAKKHNFVYIDKDLLNISFLTDIYDGKVMNKKISLNSSFFNSKVKFQTYHAMFSLAESNLSQGLNVILDGYFSDKLHVEFIKERIDSISKKFQVILIYFTCSNNVLFKRMKQRNLYRDSNKLDDFDLYFGKHKHDDLSHYDIIFDTEGDIQVNVDSLYHDIMNFISEAS